MANARKWYWRFVPKRIANTLRVKAILKEDAKGIDQMTDPNALAKIQERIRNAKRKGTPD